MGRVYVGASKQGDSVLLDLSSCRTERSINLAKDCLSHVCLEIIWVFEVCFIYQFDN